MMQAFKKTKTDLFMTDINDNNNRYKWRKQQFFNFGNTSVISPLYNVNL